MKRMDFGKPCTSYFRRYSGILQDSFDGKTLKEEEQNIFNWFITTVLPIIHVASHAKHNW